MTGKQNGKSRRRFGLVPQLTSGRRQARYPSPAVTDMTDLKEDHR